MILHITNTNQGKILNIDTDEGRELFSDPYNSDFLLSNDLKSTEGVKLYDKANPERIAATIKLNTEGEYITRLIGGKTGAPLHIYYAGDKLEFITEVTSNDYAQSMLDAYRATGTKAAAIHINNKHQVYRA